MLGITVIPGAGVSSATASFVVITSLVVIVLAVAIFARSVSEVSAGVSDSIYNTKEN